MGVVQKGLRPSMPPGLPPGVVQLLRNCWSRNPDERPSFATLKVRFLPDMRLSPASESSLRSWLLASRHAAAFS